MLGGNHSVIGRLHRVSPSEDLKFKVSDVSRLGYLIGFYHSTN